MACPFKNEMSDSMPDVHLKCASEGAACLLTLNCPGKTAFEV